MASATLTLTITLTLTLTLPRALTPVVVRRASGTRPTSTTHQTFPCLCSSSAGSTPNGAPRCGLPQRRGLPACLPAPLCSEDSRVSHGPCVHQSLAARGDRLMYTVVRLTPAAAPAPPPLARLPHTSSLLIPCVVAVRFDSHKRNLVALSTTIHPSCPSPPTRARIPTLSLWVTQGAPAGAGTGASQSARGGEGSNGLQEGLEA